MEIRIPSKRNAFSFLSPFRRKVALYALCPSETTPDKLYNVIQRKNLFGSKWTCDCPDYHYWERECKHIKKIKVAMVTAAA
jgi:hypothetical protein